MFDNIDLKLSKEDVPSINFFETLQYLTAITGEHNFKGERVVSGILGNDNNDNHFKITVSKNGVNIKNGSFCKWYLGNNLKTMGRSETKKAFEKMSDEVHLPIDKAIVTRLDAAQNIIVKYPVQVYYNHLGELEHSTRIGIGNGNGIIETLQYYQSRGLLIFYDKLKEQKDKRQQIDEMYSKLHILRYEQRHTSRLAKTFNVERVTVAMLFNDENFYIKIIKEWVNNYLSINKINDHNINFEGMKNKTDLYNLGVLALVEKQGGELNLITQIKEASKTGQLTRKQAHDLKQAISVACNTKKEFTVTNGAILELNKKVKEAAFCYR
jgi:hypothetical protein